MDGKTGARQKAPVGMLTGRVNPQPIVHADGTVEQELDESTMMYSVVRRNADGTLSTYCVHGPDQAHEVLHGKIPASVAKVVKAAKEHKYEEK